MAERKAETIVDRMVERGQLEKDEAGNSVLKWAAAVVLARDPDTGESAYPIREQLAAAKMVLDFTMKKPEQKVDATVSAEGFLQGLLTKTGR